MEDGGWPSAVGDQALAANHHKVLTSRVLVLSVVGKGHEKNGQVSIEKTNASESLLKRRKTTY